MVWRVIARAFLQGCSLQDKISHPLAFIAGGKICRPAGLRVGVVYVSTNSSLLRSF